MSPELSRREQIRHVVSYSGGIASAFAAKRVIDRYGRDGVVLLFADTKMEDEDLYRFNRDIARVLGVEITVIADGRNPWQVFRDERFLGNSRIDPCSKILKRKLLDKWLRDHAPDATRHVGIWWDEAYRLHRLQGRTFSQDRWESPLLWEPVVFQRDANAWIESVGVELPRLYRLGFSHNNCGGFCVKAGQAQFANLYRVMPDRYRWHEAQEEAIRAELGDVTILRETRAGVRLPLPLRVLRERIESQCEIDWEDTRSGCGCAIDDDSEVHHDHV